VFTDHGDCMSSCIIQQPLLNYSGLSRMAMVYRRGKNSLNFQNITSDSDSRSRFGSIRVGLQQVEEVNARQETNGQDRRNFV